MSLTTDPRPPLPDRVTDAYDFLSTHMKDSPAGDSQSRVPSISRDQAVDVLCRSDELDLEPEDADHALTRFLQRGYLYEVDDELRLTVKH